jgi:hypothetical protein
VTTVLLVSLPGPARMFHLTPLSIADWALTAVVAASIILFNEVAKRVMHGKRAA